MEKRYAIPALFLVVLALGLLILPAKNEQKEIRPEKMLTAIAGKSRYLSADQVTRRIIEKDPVLLLVDLRNAEQFKAFSLPGSLNIHPDSLLSKDIQDLFRQPGKDKVLYANSDLTAEMAWQLCTRSSMDRVYVMKGGLNEWFNTIIMEQPTPLTASSSDLNLLSLRKAARQYFTGTGSATAAPPAEKATEKIKVVRKAPAASSGGGC